MDEDPANLRLYPYGIPACDQCVIKDLLAVTVYAPGLCAEETAAKKSFSLPVPLRTGLRLCVLIFRREIVAPNFQPLHESILRPKSTRILESNPSMPPLTKRGSRPRRNRPRTGSIVSRP